MSSVPARLEANSFDIKDNCGSVNAMKHISQEHQRLIRAGLVNTQRFEQVCFHQFPRQVCPVMRQLKAGKVDLMKRVCGGGAIFTAGKKDSHKLREIWDGSRVSAASLKSPPPPHLLTPDALLNLECTAGSQICLTKRDGETLFDQLGSVPFSVKKYFGRP